MGSKRVLFLTNGTKGDLYPFLGLAVEMKRRGHRPLVLSAEVHRADCEAAGCEFESIQSKDDFQKMISDKNILVPLKGLRAYLRLGIAATTEAAYQRIEHHYSQEPGSCVLVFNSAMLAGNIAYEKLRLPVASIFLHPFSHMSFRDPPKDSPLNTALMSWIGLRGRKIVIGALQYAFDRDLAQVNQLRIKLGLPYKNRLLSDWRYTSPCMIDLWPDWYCPPKSDWPKGTVRTGFVNYDGPIAPAKWNDQFQGFLEKGFVLFTLGSGPTHELDQNIRLFSRVCLEINKNGLVVAPSPRPEQSRLSPEFRVIGPEPFARLFPYASAIVSHGGIGTVARAMAAGKPQVVNPIVNDQFDNAYQVERLGIGVSLPAKSLNANRLRHALSSLDNPAVRERCRDIENQMRRESGIDQTCDLLIHHFARRDRLVG